MKDEKKTKKQIKNELVELRQRIADLRKLKASHKQSEEEFLMAVGNILAGII